MVKLFRNYLNPPALKAPVLATIGSFDGIHLGHMEVLNTLLAERSERGGGTILVISLYPHPLKVLGKVKEVLTVTTIRQRRAIFSKLGIDTMCLLHFTRAVASWSAHRFISEVLIDKLKVEYFCVGSDARIGAQGLGNADYIVTEFERKNRRAVICDRKDLSLSEGRSQKIGSRLIRQLISEGKVESVPELLGDFFSLDSKVVPGAGRGSKLNFATINLLKNSQILPANGVYLVRTIIEGKSNFNGLANIGIRPTFGDILNPIAEVHLLDYSGPSLYSKRVEVKFLKRLRPEIRFESGQKLAEQIERDVQMARAFFQKS